MSFSYGYGSVSRTKSKDISSSQALTKGGGTISEIERGSIGRRTGAVQFLSGHSKTSIYCLSRQSQITRCQGRRRRNQGPRIQSDGVKHLGSSQINKRRAFPGPPETEGPPLRILPIGGLGEIGMNCMLVGVYNRYILIDAGLMFPDFSEAGMQKVLPDTSFLYQWKERIEAVIITHGHEDHIGAMPWVFPALDPKTPIFAGRFVNELLKDRLQQYGLWDKSRFRMFEMKKPFRAGPFSVEAVRVTHSIPDCCGLILRSEEGTIFHTGDWKIDESPIDGRKFDRETLEKLGKEEITLMMSDSTNVLTPGRSVSESVVEKSLIEKISSIKTDGRIVATMFASNLHRIGSVKKAADAAGRKMCFLGLSLHTYLAAALRSGDAPFHPSELINAEAIDDIDPHKLLLVTTGSQGESRAALSLASLDISPSLKLNPKDIVIYSAKVIPGNEKRVMKMMNRISNRGTKIVMRRDENLHASGHAYRDELEEIIKLVRPQHFLPVHGESVFLQEHALLAKSVGINNTTVIHDGEILGVSHLRNRNTMSNGSLQKLGSVNLLRFFNDGNDGTGTASDMALSDRIKISTEGIVVVAIDVMRPLKLAEILESGPGEYPVPLKGRVKITSRALWTDRGKLLEEAFRATHAALAKCPPESSLSTIDKVVALEIKRTVKKYNKVSPEVIVISHEYDPRLAFLVNQDVEQEDDSSEARRRRLKSQSTATVQKKEKKRVVENKVEEIDQPKVEEESRSSVGRRSSRRRQSSLVKNKELAVSILSEEVLENRKKSNPRETPVPGIDLDFG